MIVLFDGVCNLCNGLVTFLISHDKSGHIRFASLQSDVGRRLLENASIPPGINSVVCVDGPRAFVKSDAIVQIGSKLGIRWRWITLLRVLPRPLRDALYDLVAANRYRWFGKRTSCMVPSDATRWRFLEDEK